MAKKRANGDGHIRQRSDGRWEGRISLGFDPGTGKLRQKSIYGKSQQEVRRKMTQLTGEVDNGLYVEPGKMTVGQWLDIWSNEYLNNVKPRTKESYAGHIKLRLKPGLGATKLSALTAPIIQSFYNGLSKGEKPLSPKSIKNVHGVLHSALDKAVKVGYIRFNPANACELPRIEKPKINPLTETQAGEFLKQTQGHRWERLFYVALFTGMRESELLGLTWDCVTADTIRVESQLQNVDGDYVLTSLKNEKSRTITPAPAVMRVLQEQKRLQAEWKLKAYGAWDNELNLVFTNEAGGHLVREVVYRSFKREVAKMGLGTVRFHDLRHTYAVLALQAGDDVKTVQENLGHHSASFTLDIYGFVTEKMRKDSAARMEAYIQTIKK